MTDIRKTLRVLRWLLFLGAVFLIVPYAFSAQASQSQEEEVQKLLNQADAYSQKGDYKLAVGGYLEAAALAQSKPNLSRAYFGLALSYFYLRDMANSVKWMRKVSGVDPNKEISELFYPKGFAQLFNQVQKERREALATKAQAAAKQEIPEKAVEEKKPGQQDVRKTEPPPEKTAAPAVKQPEARDETARQAPEKMGGHWEISAHYSTWGLNLIKGLFEKSLTDELGEDIQNEVTKYVQGLHGGLVKSTYTQDLSFDTSGSNYGLEVRYYSKGRGGTFSFGLSFEKTHIKLGVSGLAKQNFTNGSFAAVDADAYIETSPFTTNFSFRWDFNSGRVVTPYFVLGVGFSALEGTWSYVWSGDYQLGSDKQSIGDSKTKTFVELSEDIDFNIPKTFILVQLNFGVKAEVYPGAFILAEAGIWDGLILRFGAACRF